MLTVSVGTGTNAGMVTVLQTNGGLASDNYYWRSSGHGSNRAVAQLLANGSLPTVDKTTHHAPCA